MERKWVHFLFASLGIGLFYLLLKVEGFLWETLKLAGPKTFILYPVAFVLALLITFVLWKSKKVFSFVSECVDELQKVSWPTWKETMSATLVVICAVIVVSIVLGVFDTLWAYLTRLLYHKPVS